ncbi:uncharacterized protein LOC106095824 [Stomoxys calcitrans]|uniref:uncharacterized protein LOC106095824 n=1 Tax=Stomoxys calcitrans TaxID=35570 RepID=UPI0027E2D7B8|nr:uncharacterized protein LOC106095824 [Stomoxys calcitrans]
MDASHSGRASMSGNHKQTGGKLLFERKIENPVSATNKSGSDYRRWPTSRPPMYSLDGRPFDPNSDLAGHYVSNNACYVPPSLKGHSFNLAEEVERGKLIARDVPVSRRLTTSMERPGFKVGRGKILYGHHPTNGGRLLDVRNESLLAQRPMILLAREDGRLLNMRHNLSRLRSPHSTFHRSIAYTPIPTSKALQQKDVAGDLSHSSLHLETRPKTPACRQRLSPQVFRTGSEYPNLVWYSEEIPASNFMPTKPSETSSNISFSAQQNRGQQQEAFKQQDSTSELASEISFVTPTADSTHYQVIKDQKRPKENSHVVEMPPMLSPAKSTLRSRNKCISMECNEGHFDHQLLCTPAKRASPPRSFLECSRKCDRTQFEGGATSEVEDACRVEILKLHLKHLVEDTYCPGLIQATLDGRENFNDISLRLSNKNWLIRAPTGDQEKYTPHDPMTLLEAFSLRIARDRNEVNKNMSVDTAEEICDSRIEETIGKHFAKQNPSELNKSVKSLLVAEAIEKKNRKKGARLSLCLVDIQKNELKMYAFDPEIVTICYIGHVKPTTDKL